MIIMVVVVGVVVDFGDALWEGEKIGGASGEVQEFEAVLML